ncbi:vacuolar protein sorting-associated protein 37B-like [Gigantopelta aegis]|uniref:vacuolar protein sorting-associated protein 37B-like n=1 Tax=Gigantopelta aegis TaxID=1735272 RepID=UPI001B88CC5C|nr:vacuolar protein sorting-associated protein 37B-like [Gigantopelta aegis]
MYSGYSLQHRGGGGGSSQSLHYDEEEALALVRFLEKDDLEKLVNDDTKLNELITDVNQVKRLQVERDTVFASNKSLAEHNLSLEPQFTQLKREVATLNEDVNTLKMNLAKDSAQLDTHFSAQSLDTTLALLQTESAVAEEKSENLADSFCKKEVSVDTFMTDYLPLRSLAHARRIKVEKMTELVRNMRNVQTQSATQPASQWMGASTAPYPTSMGGMPQPFFR